MSDQYHYQDTVIPTDTCITPTAIEQDETAIINLYLSHRHELLAYLTGVLRNRELAEDLCQETFIKALRNWPAHDQLQNPVGWLYQIARNTAIDELRRHQRIRFVDLPDEAMLTGKTSNFDTAISDREAIREALQQVPVLYRQALVLYIWADYSVKDIATICNCSISAVKARLFRARAYFREAYMGGETLKVAV